MGTTDVRNAFWQKSKSQNDVTSDRNNRQSGTHTAVIKPKVSNQKTAQKTETKQGNEENL
jgi:hypothetical protein